MDTSPPPRPEPEAAPKGAELSGASAPSASDAESPGASGAELRTAAPTSAGLPGAAPTSAGLPGAAPTSAGLPGAAATSAGLSGAVPPAAASLGAAATAADLRACAAQFRELASRRGVPEVVETPGDSLPQSTTGNVVYDLGVAFSLAFGDLAEALDVEAERCESEGR